MSVHDWLHTTLDELAAKKSVQEGLYRPIVLDFRERFQNLRNYVHQGKDVVFLTQFIENILTKNEGQAGFRLGRFKDDAILILVDRQPRLLTIGTPSGGYRTSDGYRIDAILSFQYCVHSTTALWHTDRDPLATLETLAISRTRKTLLESTIDDFIWSPSEQIDALRGTNALCKQMILQDQVETRLYCDPALKINGMQWLSIHVEINLDASADAIERYRQTLYKSSEELIQLSAHQKTVNTFLDDTKWYPPYSLRDVILAIDPTLLNKFEPAQVKQTVSLLNEKIAKKKQELVESRHRSLDELAKHIQRAKTAGMDQQKVDVLLCKYYNKQKESINDYKNWHCISNDQFFKEVIGVRR